LATPKVQLKFLPVAHWFLNFTTRK
jgi:hypothetical protein